jgi:hypothetical protein
MTANRKKTNKKTQYKSVQLDIEAATEMFKYLNEQQRAEQDWKYFKVEYEKVKKRYGTMPEIRTTVFTMPPDERVKFMKLRLWHYNTLCTQAHDFDSMSRYIMLNKGNQKDISILLEYQSDIQTLKEILLDVKILDLNSISPEKKKQIATKKLRLEIIMELMIKHKIIQESSMDKYKFETTSKNASYWVYQIHNKYIRDYPLNKFLKKYFNDGRSIDDARKNKDKASIKPIPENLALALDQIP